MDYVLGVIVFLGFGFIYVLVEDHMNQKYWEKKCRKCQLGPFYCIECKRFKHIMK